MPVAWVPLDELVAGVLRGELHNPTLVTGVAGRRRGAFRRVGEPARRARAVAVRTAADALARLTRRRCPPRHVAAPRSDDVSGSGPGTVS